ncbi:MAG: aminotransferase class I/II-fold pyridoxal phosphate-dependent enzyme [Candidatus Obscuribacter sp.]|nr:aminotransferase class I/II-fold pyridoxal phosphate-dependent enzyme [Candidatus Obscuribacter sp.]
MEENSTASDFLSAPTACASAPESINPAGSATNDLSLAKAVSEHIKRERASFHTPGHKGRLSELSPSLSLCARGDLTELPGLDDFSNPQGVLRRLEERAAAIFGSGESLLSLGGASTAIMAAIHSARELGDSIVVPRNAHRSVIEALCFTDLRPIWYEPEFDEDWQVYSTVSPETLAGVLNEAQRTSKVALVVVVSPTYAGARSDLEAICKLTRARGLSLLVDEAHGAHLACAHPGRSTAQTSGQAPPVTLSALESGADLVAHSLHKTLSGLTQTGLLHIGKNSIFAAEQVREQLLRLTSSSPSYLLMASIEAALDLVESAHGQHLLLALEDLGGNARQAIKQIGCCRIYSPAGTAHDTRTETTASHIFIQPTEGSCAQLQQHLLSRGIYPESLLGDGLLLMLGIGSQTEDLEVLITALKTYKPASSETPRQAPPSQNPALKPSAMVCPLTPFQTSQARKISIARSAALGRTAAEFLAPCPPGIPILIPGQEITMEVLESTNRERFLVVA